MLARLRLKQRFALMIGMLALGFTLFGAVAYYTLERLRIDGPVYTEIARGKDLVADILPPPAYVIEAHLIAHELLVESRPEQRARLLDEFARCEKEFGERYAFWRAQPLPERLSTILAGRAQTSGEKYFALARSQYLPAVRAGDAARARAVLVDLVGLYETHRTAIDELVKAANAENDRIEADAGSAIVSARVTLGMIFAASLGGALILAWLVSSGLIRELGGEPRYVNEVMKEIAEGDFSRDVAGGAPDSVLAAVRSTVNSLREIIRTIRDAAEKVAAGAHQIAAAAQTLSESANAGADATSSMSAAVEQMTVSIGHISDSARDSESNSARSVELASEGEERAGRARQEVSAMSTSIGDAAARIGTLVVRVNEIGAIAGVIKDIAAQTNLLALNAAIEAARAGEQGRGFAVVADEVRGLAERTAAATVQIVQMIASIQEQTQQAVAAMEAAKPQVSRGVELVDSAAASLQEIRQGAGDTLAKVRDVAGATNEQSAASTAIAQQVEQIAQMVDHTSASVKQTADAAAELERTAARLNEMLGRFRV
jgi:methyl-accepting chemotaxis protein